MGQLANLELPGKQLLKWCVCMHEPKSHHMVHT